MAIDMQKMYRQILVNTQDQDLQRIVWGNHLTVKVTSDGTVPYDTGNAPDLVILAL